MRYWPELGAGAVFGLGLAVSGMVKPEVVLSFLTLEDLGLLFVLGGGTLVTLLGFWAVPKVLSRSLDGSSFHLRKQVLDKHLLLGAAVFGVGWGVSGICPGAGIASLGVGNWPVLIAFAGMLLGTYAYAWWVHEVQHDHYG